MLNVASQSTRDRSRSRSRSSVGRRYRSTTRAVVSVPRSLRYNGINKIIRMVSDSLEFQTTASPGYPIGVTNYTSMALYFSPLGVTLYGSSVNNSFHGWSGAAELSALYELCKIDKIVVEFTIRQQAPEIAGSLVAGSPILFVATDINNVDTGSLEQTQQQAGCKMILPYPGQKTSVTVYPKYQQLVNYTSLASAFAARSGYVNANLDIPHYGLRLSVDNAPNIGKHILTYNVKAYLSLKNVK